ncbi:endosome/lysosome-associated apoptosis and autophagy regulator family member 2-like [Hydractinia symbiolongicarpus]|uniref:endosome/lysosome-associated apoptosis and autophagy regulator family member 2-like n=1 Tax=Hydractinia symbiolongicarpus TaxID=13093 RepID=UPI00254C1E43|nr:endosome/lysosome-associated apoptosis and autophagy regulator family member 2-like [Hydractinia symbiolongicarpus]
MCFLHGSLRLLLSCILFTTSPHIINSQITELPTNVTNTKVTPDTGVITTVSPTSSGVTAATASSTTATTLSTTTTTSTTTLLPTSLSSSTKYPAHIGPCERENLKYVYTPCDDAGNRWKVQVPKTECNLENPDPPEAGVSCTFTCQPGEYLDIRTQTCVKCSGGFYSVGDGKRYAKWDKFPEGFETSAHLSDSPFSSKSTGCDKAGWKLKGGYIESNGSSCRSVLKVKVDLVKNGNITFLAKAGDESAFFHVWVEGGLSCSSNYDARVVENGVTEMYYSMTRGWKKHTLNLEKGHNTIYFVAAYFTNSFEKESTTFDTSSEKSVLIKEIVIRGFSYSLHCEPCEAGTFSKPGAASCKPCKKNTFSSKEGSKYCIECDKDTEYAPPHSDRCIQRKACEISDYHMYWERCHNQKTRKKYAWNKPRICKIESVNLPPNSEEIDCPKCNPGMYNNGSACIFCPLDQYSNGGEDCRRCAPRTRSVPGLFYKVWTQYPPPPMHLYCIARPDSGCLSKKGWVMQQDAISSGVGHADDAELIMFIVVPAFTKSRSEFKMTFEIVNCGSDTCRLKIQSMDDGHNAHSLQTYEGDHDKFTFTHTRFSSEGTRYRIIFEKKYDEYRQTFRHREAEVKIYEIEVTNAFNGGAQKCEKCDTSSEGGCIKCEAGQYIENSKCVDCPAGTYLKKVDNPEGRSACAQCPKNTHSSPKATSCYSDCNMNLDGREYNFTELSGFHVVNAGKRFTSLGYGYYHAYNISFCGEGVFDSVCHDHSNRDNNSTQKGKKKLSVRGAVCRSTMIPDGDTVLTAQSMIVGKRLESVKLVRDTTNHTKKDLLEASKTHEILVTFASPERTTHRCMNGTFTIIRLVCDPIADGKGVLDIGDKKMNCSTETCDGCNFLFTWKSKHACPKCTASDIQNITTGCTDGNKKMHFLWKQPHVCTGGIKPEDKVLECSIFEKSILDLKVVIMGFMLGALLLAAIVIFLCYRNRRLNYQYHRLIDASQMKDGELPASEKCALEDGEEDEEVILSRGKGSNRIMDRIKGLGKNKNKFSEFETINLDSMKGYSDDDDDEI